ncbi:MAG: glycosyltransferase family 4 protein [Parcubacteria group bacterium]
MKIAHIACHVPPDAGGIGMAAHSYADQLFERGHEVAFFVPRTKKNSAEAKRYALKLLVPFMRIGLGAVMPQLFWRLSGFDVIHLHYPLLGSSLIVALRKRMFPKAKLIITYHQDLNLRGWRKIYEKAGRRLFLNFILESADKIIVSSFDYIENSRIQKYYFTHIGKFAEIPFGVPRFYRPMPKDPALLKMHGLSIGDKVVLFVGGLGASHYFKGVNYLIRAISLIDDKSVKALIVGSGSLLESYEKQAQEMNLTDRVKFTGFVGADILPKYYNLGDIFVLPSINTNEAFGIVLIEAMACGKPVIASNLKGVRSVVDVGVNGLLVEPRNSKDIADKIMYFVNNPGLATKFGQNCLDSVEKKYRWSRITDRLLEVYSNL